jgi:hypothetical protein
VSYDFNSMVLGEGRNPGGRGGGEALIRRRRQGVDLA